MHPLTDLLLANYLLAFTFLPINFIVDYFFFCYKLHSSQVVQTQLIIVFQNKQIFIKTKNNILKKNII